MLVGLQVVVLVYMGEVVLVTGGRCLIATQLRVVLWVSASRQNHHNPTILTGELEFHTLTSKSADCFMMS